MSAKKTDIEQLSSYLKGELDAHAMHVLEKQALNDPFLMDALEGLEAAGTDPNPAVADLDQRLARRTEPGDQRSIIIPWRALGIAASVLLVLSIGGWWIFNQTKVSPPKQATALLEKTTPADKKPADTLVSIKPANTTLARAAKHPPKKITGTLATTNETEPPAQSDLEANFKSESKNYGYNAAAVPKLDSFSLAKAKDANFLKEVKIRGAQPLAQQTLLSKVPGVNIHKPERRLSPEDELAITGKISNHNLDVNTQPIPDYTKGLKDTNNTGFSNGATQYSGAADKSKAMGLTSNVNQAQRFNAQVKDSSRRENVALNEVAIGGAGNAKKSAKAIPEAHPQMGWETFNKYLKAKALAGKAGNVRLTFLVNGDGTLSDFVVTKSMDELTDQQAINLVKNGPNWQPNADGKPEIVNLRVHFSKKP